MINKIKEKEFWKKYKKHIKDNKCQFVMTKFCNRPATRNCIMCDYPACTYCFKLKMNDRYSRFCFNCLKDTFEEEDIENFMDKLLLLTDNNINLH